RESVRDGRGPARRGDDPQLSDRESARARTRGQRRRRRRSAGDARRASSACCASGPRRGTGGRLATGDRHAAGARGPTVKSLQAGAVGLVLAAAAVGVAVAHTGGTNGYAVITVERGAVHYRLTLWPTALPAGIAASLQRARTGDASSQA